MAFLCVFLLSIGYLFLFPIIVWNIDLPTLFEIQNSQTTGAKIEEFLKRYNFIDSTSADFASNLILITFIFTIIFFIMALIILNTRKDKKVFKNEYKKVSQKLAFLSTYNDDVKTILNKLETIDATKASNLTIKEIKNPQQEDANKTEASETTEEK